VPVGHQDGCGVPVAPPILAGRVDQLLDLSLGQILPWTAGGLRTVTSTDLGAQERTAVFPMVSPIAEYKLLQLKDEL